MTYHKHIVTKARVVFRTHGTKDVQYARLRKQDWLNLGRPEKVKL